MQQTMPLFMFAGGQGVAAMPSSFLNAEAEI